MTGFSSKQTSASFLVKVLERRAGDGSDADAQARYELGFDVYIKASSYSILNKVFFWLAVVTALCVFLWPAVVVLAKSGQDDGALARSAEGLSLLASAVTQTMITALGSFFVLVYSHYKAKQTAAENLLRAIVFEDAPLRKMSDAVIEEMAKIDKGLSFNLKSSDKG